MYRESDLYKTLQSADGINEIIGNLVDNPNNTNLTRLVSSGTGGSWAVPTNILIQVISGYYSKSDKEGMLNELSREIRDFENSTDERLRELNIKSKKRTELIKSIIELCFDINSYGELRAPESITDLNDRIVLSNACFILSLLACSD